MPWSTEPWELVLVPAPASDKIATVVLRGATDDENHRRHLFSALRQGLGVEPSAGVTDLGRFEVRYLGKSVKARVVEPADNRWVVTLERK